MRRLFQPLFLFLFLFLFFFVIGLAMRNLGVEDTGAVGGEEVGGISAHRPMRLRVYTWFLCDPHKFYIIIGMLTTFMNKAFVSRQPAPRLSI